MKHCENANVMHCMSKHDHLNKTQPKNFVKISSILKNPKNFSKTQKPKSKWMKCMIQERKEIIPNEEHKVWAENQVGNIKRLSEKCLGERKEIFYREKWRENHAEAIYKKHEARWIESCRGLILNKFIYQGAIKSYQTAKKSRWIKQLSSIYWVDRKFLNGSRIYREAIKTNSQKFRWIEIALTSIEKGRSKISIDS